MTSKKDRQVIRTRNIIIAFVVMIAVLVVGYGALYTTGLTEGEPVAGDDYRVIEDAPARRPGEPIEVREFFSYGCVHCRNFDPLIEEWLEDIPPGVTFRRTPVVFSPVWILLAQTFYALEALDALEQNHTRLFRAIHDNGRQFLSPDMIADFVDGNGVSREDFLRTFNSPAIRRKVTESEQDQRALQIASVPTLVVAERYVIGMDAGRKRALEIVDELIAREMAENKPDPAP